MYITYVCALLTRLCVQSIYILNPNDGDCTAYARAWECMQNCLCSADENAATESLDVWSQHLMYQYPQACRFHSYPACPATSNLTHCAPGSRSLPTSNTMPAQNPHAVPTVNLCDSNVVDACVPVCEHGTQVLAFMHSYACARLDAPDINTTGLVAVAYNVSRAIQASVHDMQPRNAKKGVLVCISGYAPPPPQTDELPKASQRVPYWVAAASLADALVADHRQNLLENTSCIVAEEKHPVVVLFVSPHQLTNLPPQQLILPIAIQVRV